MSVILLATSYSLLVAGVIVAYFLAKIRRLVGVGVGFSVSLIGAMTWIDNYSLLSQPFVNGGFLTGSVLFVTLVYFISGRNPRVFLLLGYLLIPIAYASIGAFPLILIYIYVAVSIAIFSALDFSRVDMTSCMQNSHKYLRRSLWPYSLIERFLKRSLDRTKLRPALIGSYLAFVLAVTIALPVAIAEISGGVVTSEDLIFVAVFLLLLPFEECSTGLKRIGDKNDADR